MDGTNKKANFVCRKGERIGRYEIVDVLDQTGFKDTYLGQQIPLRIPVIIEVFRTLKRAFLQGSIQPLAGLLPHLKQIAAALQHAHHQQVLHGDVRPENVLLDGNNNLLLRGFTFEAVMQNRERLNYQLGGMMLEAVAYSAPEQIRGKAEPASDQYSLAILIYELLCGAVPFTGSSIEVAHQQMHALPPSPRQRVPTISARVEGAIMKALEKDPGRRFSDIQTFINTLFKVATAQRQPAPTQPAGMVAPQALPQAVMPLASPPPVASAPVKDNPPPPRRRDNTTMTRRAFAVGLVGLAAAGGAGGWYLLQKRLALPAPPAVGPNATPPAKQTTVNHTKVLIFTGHLASVNALAWSPDGKLIASASDDTYVQIFDATSGRRKIIYSGHTEEVAAVAWSPDSKFIASGGQDTTVQVWNANSGARILTYKGHADRVNGVSWSNDSQSIASGSEDKTVQVWNAISAALRLSIDFGEARLMRGNARKWQFGVTSDCELEVPPSVSCGKNCRLAIKDGQVTKACFQWKYS